MTTMRCFPARRRALLCVLLMAISLLVLYSLTVYANGDWDWGSQRGLDRLLHGLSGYNDIWTTLASTGETIFANRSASPTYARERKQDSRKPILPSSHTTAIPFWARPMTR